LREIRIQDGNIPLLYDLEMKGKVFVASYHQHNEHRNHWQDDEQVEPIDAMSDIPA